MEGEGERENEREGRRGGREGERWGDRKTHRMRASIWMTSEGFARDD